MIIANSWNCSKLRKNINNNKKKDFIIIIVRVFHNSDLNWSANWETIKNPERKLNLEKLKKLILIFV